MMEAEDEPYYADEADEVDDADDSGGAPIYEVPPREIIAIEHPSVILNLDKGLATFGSDPNFQKLLVDSGEPASVPLWFRPDNPASKPILSHHTATNNILLKITVPKRTGRKRKRGSNEPFSGDVDISDGTTATSGVDQVSSQARRDLPKSILRKMQDNPEDYQVEAVGNIHATHRYRGLADFQFANTSPSFLTNIAEHMLPMKVSKLRKIKFAPGVATGPGQEIIPPPHFTDRVIGFNYNYEQNPNTKVEGDEAGKQQLVNIQGRKKHSYGHFINNNQYPVPEKPRREPAMQVPEGLMSQLHALMDERPIWTRRAILNRVTGNYSDSVLRIALQLIGYQFRGGPWRDAFIKYGVDPRPDPSFRIYQTLAFKLERNIIGTKKIPWEVVRKGQVKKRVCENRDSHLWNGEDYSTDGKFWQVCDITDPFVRGIIDNAPLRETCDLKDSGWYHKGTWSKVKMVMKVKMVAIKRGRMGSDNDHPQKPGFLYNSFLEDRIRPFPDITDKPLGLTLEPFLRPMEELDMKFHKRRAPPTQKQKPGSAAGDAVSTPGGDDTLEPDDATADGAENDGATPMNSWDVEDLDGDDDAEGDADEEYGYYDNGDGEEGGEEYGEDAVE
ncbi:RNA polymerase III transcription factor IIIC subunit-domain-containing protein [Daldinia caldariorum]|uniref:RNA polymerase III transcription factor IIIC subunit-domain-containing protein n=1 Tax=Daldinia caldariorum TaxID=326644 RepID=UPI0020073E68|nr:RNA polymerase III transcription factor IIIC subunit-domain-containing protein [Daldinia caldariorum]KAI1468943.1 RNA polymerase III transcription factor IIIC subunit-domain-containing protein [Daldinia caldariorum]